MYSENFEYYRPASVQEAIQLLGEHPGAKLLAGGHSLLPSMKLRVASAPALVDIGRIAELRGIGRQGDALVIGALTTHTEVVESETVRSACPLLAETAMQIGDQQVRNRGTIGGSLAHADPAADYPTTMMALRATMTAAGPDGRREITADEFFTDLFTTALRPDEVLTAVRVPVMGSGQGGAYKKHRHPASSYAVVSVAAWLHLSNGTIQAASVTTGGATPKPVRCTTVESALRGKAPGAETFKAAAEMVREAIADPIGDLYASGEYRTHLATVLAGRALMQAAERAGG